MRRFSKISTVQLARICGVSQGTVDRALHNRDGINPETRERILRVAKEYDYIPAINGADQTNSMLIGVVLFDLYNEFFSKLAMSIVNIAREYGYSIIFQFSEKNEQNEKAAIEYFDYIGVDGIILFSVGSDSAEYENYLRSLKKPLVLIGNRMFDLTFIGIDDFSAMFELTHRVANTAHSGDIVYYAPILKKELHSTNAQRLRLDGFVSAVKTLDKPYRIATDIDELTRFGCIVSPTDYYVLRVLKHFGYPNDIKIGGFDNISLLKSINSSVLTVDYSTDKIAEECMNYILGRRYEPQIEYKLVYNSD